MNAISSQIFERITEVLKSGGVTEVSIKHADVIGNKYVTTFEIIHPESTLLIEILGAKNYD